MCVLNDYLILCVRVVGVGGGGSGNDLYAFCIYILALCQWSPGGKYYLQRVHTQLYV